MTTDPIAAARALIEPLTEYTPEPWRAAIYDNAGFINVPLSGYDGDFKPADARLMAAAPDLRDMVATLADALEAERAERERAESAETEYRRKNHRLMVEMEQAHAAAAAAYEAAALFSESQRREGDSFYNDGWCACATVVAGGIRNITPADAQAALDKLLAEARLEGWRAGRDAAAAEADKYAASCLNQAGDSRSKEQFETAAYFENRESSAEYIALMIRALPEPKEARHDD